MQIDLSKLTDAALALLIRNAADELNDRLSDNPHIKRVPASARPPLVINEPPAADRAFAMLIKARLIKKQYIKATERQRIEEIAEKYSAWIEEAGLPTKSSGSAWRDAAERISLLGSMPK